MCSRPVTGGAGSPWIDVIAAFGISRPKPTAAPTVPPTTSPIAIGEVVGGPVGAAVGLGLEIPNAAITSIQGEPAPPVTGREHILSPAPLPPPSYPPPRPPYTTVPSPPL